MFLLLLSTIFINAQAQVQPLSWPEAEQFGLLAEGSITANNSFMVKGSIGALGTINSKVKPTGTFYNYGQGNVSLALDAV